MIKLLKVFKAMLIVAPSDNVIYYLNAVHIEHQGDKCVIEATDEAMALRVSVPSAWFAGVLTDVGDRMLVTRESLENAVNSDLFPNSFRRPARDERVYFQAERLDTFDANFPKLDTAKPRPDGTHSVQIDTDRLEVLLQAVRVLREGCTRNVSRLGVGGNVGLAGYVDNVDYVAFLAPASR